MEKTTYPFYINGNQTGYLTSESDGLRVRLEATSDIVKGGIYRAYAVSNGEFIPVGIMIPEGGQMTAAKTHSLSSLGREVNITHGEAHLSHLTPQSILAQSEQNSEFGGEIEAESEGFEEAEDMPSDSPASSTKSEGREERTAPDISALEKTPAVIGGWTIEAQPERLFYDYAMRSAVMGKKALIKWHEGRIMLALSYPENAEFPLAPMFCLSDIEYIDGERYVVYTIGDTGTPYVPRYSK